jgi:hypothetical protein
MRFEIYKVFIQARMKKELNEKSTKRKDKTEEKPIRQD